ncbi:MAG: HNH endonuclease [Clostridia bacterium]|nr:HNH endonuclease [Clostridia bacterium]
MHFNPETVKELLDWAYANLAAYQVALQQDPPSYNGICWATRTHIYNGLKTGSLTRRSIYQNERSKLKNKDICIYCGTATQELTLDHLFAKSKGGTDSADNLVYCCRSCNASKNNRDYFEWISNTHRKVNIDAAERYLKNAYQYCDTHQLLFLSLENVPASIPFNIRSIPVHYPIDPE